MQVIIPHSHPYIFITVRNYYDSEQLKREKLINIYVNVLLNHIVVRIKILTSFPFYLFMEI
jgi:hypothetical protein